MTKVETMSYQDYGWVQPHGPFSVDKNNFPVQLHKLLSTLETENRTDVASWCPHGRAIRVHDKETFEKEFLSKWFKQSKYASFQRQLCAYGFIRITYGPDKGCFYHELFLRGKLFLVSRMQRYSKRPQEARREGPLPPFDSLPPLQTSPLQHQQQMGIMRPGGPAMMMLQTQAAAHLPVSRVCHMPQPMHPTLLMAFHARQQQMLHLRQLLLSQQQQNQR